MHKNTAQALAFFEQMLEVRALHLAIMEKFLLPAFIEVSDSIPEGARPLYFEREKKQILKYLDKHVRLLGEIVLNPEKMDIVSLFEDYTWLKDLLDHHDAREKAFLFPVLDGKEFAAKKDLLEKTRQKLASLQELNHA